MKKFFICFFVITIFLFGNLFFIKSSYAEYLTYSGYDGKVDETSNYCLTGDYGIATYGIADDDTGHGCVLRVFFQVPAGKTLSYIKVYYYDHSGSQAIYAYLKKGVLSTGSYSTLASFSDSSTSSSVQSYTLSYGSALSSDYTYYLEVHLYYGTQYRGMKVYYY